MRKGKYIAFTAMRTLSSPLPLPLPCSKPKESHTGRCSSPLPKSTLSDAFDPLPIPYIVSPSSGDIVQLAVKGQENIPSRHVHTQTRQQVLWYAYTPHAKSLLYSLVHATFTRE